MRVVRARARGAFFFLFGFRISHDWNTQVGLRSRWVGRTYKTRGELRPLTSADHCVIARESELDYKLRYNFTLYIIIISRVTSSFFRSSIDKNTYKDYILQDDDLSTRVRIAPIRISR